MKLLVYTVLLLSLQVYLSQEYQHVSGRTTIEDFDRSNSYRSREENDFHRGNTMGRSEQTTYSSRSNMFGDSRENEADPDIKMGRSHVTPINKSKLFGKVQKNRFGKTNVTAKQVTQVSDKYNKIEKEARNNKLNISKWKADEAILNDVFLLNPLLNEYEQIESMRILLKKLVAYITEEQIQHLKLQLQQMLDKIERFFREIHELISMMKWRPVACPPQLSGPIEYSVKDKHTPSLIYKPTDCMGLRNKGFIKNGVYTIFPKGHSNICGINVYCDMVTDGGGWTVLLNRREEHIQENFDRNWDDYKEGFGNPAYEYWIGNEALHLLTKAKPYMMRADTFPTKRSPDIIWKEYSNFAVDTEEERFRLTLTGYYQNSTMIENSSRDGGTCDGIDGQIFYTTDRSEQEQVKRKVVSKKGNFSDNCANRLSAGFWYSSCCEDPPTALYGEIFYINPFKYTNQLQLKMRPV